MEPTFIRSTRFRWKTFSRTAPACFLILLCHKLYAQTATQRAARKLLHEVSGDPDTQGRYRMGVMSLGANPSSLVAGSGEVSGRSVVQDGRRGLRGKNGSFPISRSRTPQYITFRDGEIPASCGLHSDLIRVPA